MTNKNNKGLEHIQEQLNKIESKIDIILPIEILISILFFTTVIINMK